MKQFAQELCKWRHELHEQPELAFEEVRTAAYIAEKMAQMGYEVHTGIGKTGVVATMKVGSGTRMIGLRADMDAIGQSEKGKPAYRSRNEGRMHGCGHDGHVTTMLGAAKLLAERKNFNGTVCFVFQPAEEPGKGSEAMMRDGLLERFPLDEIYGMHNMPSLPAGTIHTRVGGIMGSEDNFTITIHGKGGHASSPQLGTDPLVIASQIILAFQTIISRNASPIHQLVISCTELHTDGMHNVIPSNVTITGDTRSCTVEDQKLIEERMKAISENICAAGGATCDFSYTHEFTPTVNWRECTEHAIAAAKTVVGAENVFGDCEPWMASEDFGHFLEKVPGCFLFLGSGRNPVASENIPLHNPYFDYNDDVLQTGAEFFAELVHERLS